MKEVKEKKNCHVTLMSAMWLSVHDVNRIELIDIYNRNWNYSQKYHNCKHNYIKKTWLNNNILLYSNKRVINNWYIYQIHFQENFQPVSAPARNNNNDNNSNNNDYPWVKGTHQEGRRRTKLIKEREPFRRGFVLRDCMKVWNLRARKSLWCFWGAGSKVPSLTRCSG